MPNAGFPSWSPGGKASVYLSDVRRRRDGLRLFNMEDQTVKSLTNGPDNLPYWSPDGSRILFTRKDGESFDIYTIKPDGAGLRRMTDYPASDVLAVRAMTGSTFCGTAASTASRTKLPSTIIPSNPMARSGS